MTADRFVGLLANGAVAVLLVTLVVAAFTIEPRPAPATTVDAVARVMPQSRYLARTEPPDAAVAQAPQAPVDDVLVVPPPALATQPVVVVETPSPAPVVAPVARVVVPVVTSDTSDAEIRMLGLMNASRVAGGLVPLVMDAAVAATARAHSDVESRYGYVYHDGPDGSARARDASACGTGWYGENTGKVWDGNVTRLHVEFMSEPWEPINHRTNIMDPAFRRVGVGAVQGRDAMYLTMVFCR
jgi:uncharacterized protein YkwD